MKDRPFLNIALRVAVAAALAAGLYVSSLYHYLLFHVLAEVFGITISFSLFLIVYNARRYRTSDAMALIGVSSLFVAILQAAHMLTYKGMAIFAGYDANLPTQLWIATRYMQSLSLLVVAHLLGRKVSLRYVFAGYAALTTVILWSTFGEWFPACYVEGLGLTPFKIVSEYIISLILAAAMVVLWRRREALERRVLFLLEASIATGIIAEMTFTSYIGVYDLANLLGHYLVIVSVYLMYKAIIETSLERPYSLLFRDLEQSRKELLALNETLEARVQERTLVAEQRARQLSVLTAQLAQAEQRERRRLAQVLHDGLQQLLVGMYFRLGVLEKRVPAESLALVREVADLLQESIDASRSLVIDLSPPVLYERGLAEALKWLGQWMQDKHGLAVRVQAEAPAGSLTEDLRLLLFQGVRELLFNIVKHAGVREAQVELSAGEGAWQVVVSDLGAGMNVERARGGATGTFGLFSLQQRVEAVGGSLEIESAPDQGTRVTMRVPDAQAGSAPALAPRGKPLATPPYSRAAWR